MASSSNPSFSNSDCNVSVPHLSNLIVNRKDHLKIVDNLKDNSSVGPDLIVSWLIKNCFNDLSYAVLELFNESLSVRHMPSIWKSAFITPVYTNFT